MLYRKEDTDYNRFKRWNEKIADDPVWEDAIVDRVKLMVERDKNRFCIVMWSMGKRGIIFGVASGRQKPCVRKLFEPVLNEIFILADNGTDIWSSQYQTSMKLPYDLYTELIDDIHELEGYSIMACKPDVAYFE